MAKPGPGRRRMVPPASLRNSGLGPGEARERSRWPLLPRLQSTQSESDWGGGPAAPGPGGYRGVSCNLKLAQRRGRAGDLP